MAEPTDDDRKAERQADSRAAGIFVYSRTAAGLLFLVTLAVGTRIYSTIEFAYVQKLLLTYMAAIALGSLGLPEAVFYFLGRTPERGAAIVRQTSMLLLIAAVPVIAVVIGAGAWMSTPTLDLTDALPWLALMLLLELPTQPAINQLLASGHAVSASVLYVGFEALRVLAILVPGFSGLPLGAAPIALAAVGLLRLIAHLTILRRFYPLPDGERWLLKPELWAIFTFALPAGLASMVGKLNPQIDKYVVGIMLGDHEFGVYTAAAWEIPLISAIPFAIAAVMQVRYVRLFATDKRNELRELWYQTVEKTALIVIPVTMVFLIVADDLIQIVAAPEYAAAATPFRIFTVVLLHRVAAYGPMLQAIGRIRMLMVTSTLILVTNLVLNVPLTWLIGYNGSAIATTIANVPAWMVSLHFIGKVWGRGIPSALPWRFYGKVLLVATVLGIAVYVATRYLGGGPAVRMAAATAVFIALYLGVGRLVGVLRPEDTAYLRGWVSFGLIKK